MVREFVMIEGACAAGIATVETLEGGPPSSDFTYVLPHARSAVSFAVAIDQKLIPPYLMKRERLAFEQENIRANALASGIALHVANYLQQKGYPSVPVAANLVYRLEASGGETDYIPDISHRYLAVRSGVGYMGLSGNIITKNQGAAIILGAAVTTAQLLPTNPLPAEENYCDDCRLCMASCISDFMDTRDKTCISLGGVEFEYSKRRQYGRCDCVCSGYTGLHSSGKWSTWSPGRFVIPDNDEGLAPAQERMARAYRNWPAAPGGRYFFYRDEKYRTVCGNCQLVCCPDKDERRARHKMLVEGGVVVQNLDGSLEAVSSQDAVKRLASMPTARRALYEDL
jgi:epoxyqueuosine reductase